MVGPEMSLGDLAEALGSTTNRLSMVIREGLDTSFYALVNRHRLAEFERLARDPARKDHSVLDLAFEAGFNSKASFYRVFREKHGTTPSAFRGAVSPPRATKKRCLTGPAGTTAPDPTA